jgi:hypothetical protein
VGSTWVNIKISLNTRDRTYTYCSTALCSRPNEHNTKVNVICLVFSHMLTTSKSTCHIKFLVYHHVVHISCLFPLPSETLLPAYQTTMRQTSDDSNCSILFFFNLKTQICSRPSHQDTVRPRLQTKGTTRIHGLRVPYPLR